RSELALRAVGAVERERRRLIELRVIAPVSTPAAPASVGHSVALLTADEADVLMSPAARVHLIHTRSLACTAAHVTGLSAEIPGRASCLVRAMKKHGRPRGRPSVRQRTGSRKDPVASFRIQGRAAGGEAA